MKRILACIACVLIVAITCSAVAEETAYVLVGHGQTVNVRRAPSADSDRLCTFERGRVVTIDRVVDGYAHVALALNNTGGWIDIRFLSSEKPEELETGAFLVTANKTRVRTKPNGEVKKRLDKGATVEVFEWLEADGELWAKVSGGYILADLLEKETVV